MMTQFIAYSIGGYHNISYFYPCIAIRCISRFLWAIKKRSDSASCGNSLHIICTFQNCSVGSENKPVQNLSVCFQDSQLDIHECPLSCVFDVKLLFWRSHKECIIHKTPLFPRFNLLLVCLCRGVYDEKRCTHLQLSLVSRCPCLKPQQWFNWQSLWIQTLFGKKKKKKTLKDTCSQQLVCT